MHQDTTGSQIDLLVVTVVALKLTPCLSSGLLYSQKYSRLKLPKRVYISKSLSIKYTQANIEMYPETLYFNNSSSDLR